MNVSDVALTPAAQAREIALAFRRDFMAGRPGEIVHDILQQVNIAAGTGKGSLSYWVAVADKSCKTVVMDMLIEKNFMVTTPSDISSRILVGWISE